MKVEFGFHSVDNLFPMRRCILSKSVTLVLVSLSGATVVTLTEILLRLMLLCLLSGDEESFVDEFRPSDIVDLYTNEVGADLGRLFGSVLGSASGPMGDVSNRATGLCC